MARTWLSIRVELIEGGAARSGRDRGRLFAAARTHTFGALAEAIDTAFARWDRAHLWLFELADGTDVCGPIPWDEPEGSVAATATRLSRLSAGEQLLYTFDMGDDWTHLCTVADERIDPLGALGIIPSAPLPYWGWGIPAQYGRRMEDDDGESPLPPDPQLSDLPPLRAFWGPGAPTTGLTLSDSLARQGRVSYEGGSRGVSRAKQRGVRLRTTSVQADAAGDRPRHCEPGPASNALS